MCPDTAPDPRAQTLFHLGVYTLRWDLPGAVTHPQSNSFPARQENDRLRNLTSWLGHLPACTIMVKWLNSSLPQFLPLSNGGDNSDLPPRIK